MTRRYTCTHKPEEGGFELSRFPAVSDWLRRVEALQGYRPLGWTPE